jgi:hypothetical protein
MYRDSKSDLSDIQPIASRYYLATEFCRTPADVILRYVIVNVPGIGPRSSLSQEVQEV